MKKWPTPLYRRQRTYLGPILTRVSHPILSDDTGHFDFVNRHFLRSNNIHCYGREQNILDSCSALPAVSATVAGKGFFRDRRLSLCFAPLPRLLVSSLL